MAKKSDGAERHEMKTCFLPTPNTSFKDNQLKVSCIFFQEKNYLPANMYLKKKVYINGIRWYPIFCTLPFCCIIRSFCTSIYRNTSFFLMTVWYSNV